ncbi:hypothetical protein KR200_005923 [Drosophila serrata]|nr:hypothetical protein KR200_005923 [Drosophila serrata]
MSDSDSDPEEELFHRAADHVTRQTNVLSSTDLLALYAYYKQALEGPCEGPCPSLLQPKARSKWQAWHNLGKMTPSAARQAYIQKLETLQPEWKSSSKDKSRTGWVVHSIESAPIEEQRSESDKTLFDHVKENNLEKLRELLSPGNLLALDENGMSLLHWATDRNAVDIIKFLVRSGASVDQRDAEQQTPLHYAASCGHLEALKCLLALQADPELCDSNGQTCYDVADDEHISGVLQAERQRLTESESVS